MIFSLFCALKNLLRTGKIFLLNKQVDNDITSGS